MYFRLSIQGTIGSTEVWSVNPCFDVVGVVAPVWDQELGDEITQALLTVEIPATLKAFLSTSAAVRSYRLEGRSDAHELLGVSTAAFSGTQGVGTGSPSKSPQAAWVASLRTDTPGGRGRGRLYWPALNVGLASSTFRIDPGVVNNAVGAMSSYLTDLETTIREGGTVFPWSGTPLCVVSKASGQRPAVVRIAGGDVLDNQRRRRDAIPETYVNATYPAA